MSVTGKDRQAAEAVLPPAPDIPGKGEYIAPGETKESTRTPWDAEPAA